MAIVWVLLILAAVVVLAVASARRHGVRHRIRYIDSQSWQERHWRDEHERARVAQEHALEDHL
jgi:hypothetical protein